MAWRAVLAVIFMVLIVAVFVSAGIAILSAFDWSH